MGVARRKPVRMTVPDFIEMIRPYPDHERWELLDGEPILMPPPVERHQAIVGNLLASLRSLAQARHCRALPGLGLLNDEVDDYAPIPDVVVRCGPMLKGGYATDPVLVAEVLFPSTMANDRGRKLDFYQGIPSLRTILIAYADEKRIEAWQRAGGEWERTVLKGETGELDLPELGGTLSLADAYDGVDLT